MIRSVRDVLIYLKDQRICTERNKYCETIELVIVATSGSIGSILNAIALELIEKPLLRLKRLNGVTWDQLDALFPPYYI